MVNVDNKENRRKEGEHKVYNSFIYSLADVISKYGVQLLDKRTEELCTEKEKNVSCIPE